LAATAQTMSAVLQGSASVTSVSTSATKTSPSPVVMVFIKFIVGASINAIPATATAAKGETIAKNEIVEQVVDTLVNPPYDDEGEPLFDYEEIFGPFEFTVRHESMKEYTVRQHSS
jgi:hypothetical protein